MVINIIFGFLIFLITMVINFDTQIETQRRLGAISNTRPKRP
jgi:hypothetical protein